MLNLPCDNRMEESTSSENVRSKTKAEEQNSLYHTDSITQSMEANSTSLADIFDTAFTSAVDPSPQSRFNSGIGRNICSTRCVPIFINYYMVWILYTLRLLLYYNYLNYMWILIDISFQPTRWNMIIYSRKATWRIRM